jgi:MarR family transcriptional repressor of emrRAB
MTEARDSRLVNVMGAFALALADRVRIATETASNLTGAAPVAIVALQQFLGGRTMDALADATGLTHSGAVRLVDRLAVAGLVERRPGHDGRSLSIVLTASGRTLSRRLTAARADAIASTLDALSVRDRRALLPLFDTLVATIAAQKLEARTTSDDDSAWLCRLCDFESCGRARGACPAALGGSDSE